MLTNEDLKQIKSIIDDSIHNSVTRIVKDEINNFSINLYQSLPTIIGNIVDDKLKKQNQYLDTKFEMLAEQMRKYTNVIHDEHETRLIDHEKRISKLENSYIIRDK